MTEKRFECDKGSRIIIDNETKLHYIMTLDWECRLVTKLLNRFAEENEELKEYKQKVAKAFKVAIKETTLTEQTENSLRAISKILEVDLE